MDIVGYSDPLSVAAGERIRFMVSTTFSSYDADFVRLTDRGRSQEHVDGNAAGTYPGRDQPLLRGSHVVVDTPGPLCELRSFVLKAWIWPTTPQKRGQGVITAWDGSAGFGLFLDGEAGVSLWVGDGETIERVATNVPLRERTWYLVSAAFDEDARCARVEQRPRERWPVGDTAARASRDVGVVAVAAAAPLVLAARGDPARGHFNGKIEEPSVARAFGEPPLAAWDFGRDFDSDVAYDGSGNERHGRVVNLPLRAVTGRRWTGRETNYVRAPGEYAAIHFHDDDLEDARWEPGVELEVPGGWRSGVYALRLRAGAHEDRVPFFVRPRAEDAPSKIVFLAPTLSYLAYANEHASWAHPIPATPKLDEILASVGRHDRYAAEQRLLSIYEHHSDDSGVAYSSRLRPIVNMRAEYAMPLLRGGPHQFPADMELVGWLERLGEPYDVVTDEDLHREGAALLERYRVVVTGSHPEYWTGDMLDALDAYLAGGGRLMYLGGNGFYWVTSVFPDKPHILEVRRGQSGTRVWQSEPGENHHASTGEPGGLWRHRGRPPQALVGVGFTAQGFDVSLPYRRGQDAEHPRAAFVFDGVEGQEIGRSGSTLGAAAGFEIDRLDFGLGTPPHALLLATAIGFSDVYQGVVEEILTADSQQSGSVSPDVRSDVVLFEGPNGGAVFAVGSIAWCGALAHEVGDDDVARITENVLRRFLDPTPLLASSSEDAETGASANAAAAVGRRTAA